MDQDVQSVLRSQEYFRLKRAIQGPGDIFELDESTKTIYLGPDSDIGEVLVTYFNPSEPLGLETAVVSVNGPFVGRVDTLPKTTVPSTGQPARILLSPVDIVDNAYTPPLDTVALRQFNIPALIDLIIAVKPINNVPEVRADRTYRFPSVPYDNINAPPPDPADNDGSTLLIVPIYGRRMVTVTLVGDGVTAFMYLATLQPGSNPVPRFVTAMILGANIPADPTSITAVIRASDAGRHGQTQNAGGTIVGSYNESDQTLIPIDGLSAGVPPQPRGMADLLVVRLNSNGNSMVPFTNYVDVYIKTTDRET